MKRRAVIFAVAGILAATSLTGCNTIRESDVVVSAGDTKITATEANFYARYMQAQYETYYGSYLGDNMWTTEAEEGKTYEQSVKSSLLTELKNMVVLKEHMDDYDVKLSKDEKKSIKEAAKEFVKANDEDEASKVSGDQKTIENVLTYITIEQKMRTAIQDTADTNVSDEEAAQKSMQYVVYSYTESDDSGNSVAVSDDRKKELKAQAETFAEGAKTAEDFEAYANEQGAELRTATFDSETTTPNEELIKAADALEEGGVTDLVETDEGCYIAKVTSLLDRTATDNKKTSIVSERKSDLFTKTCKDWIKKDGVKVDKKVWKKIRFTDLSVKIKQNETEDAADDTTEETTTSSDTNDTTEETTNSSETDGTTEEAAIGSETDGTEEVTDGSETDNAAETADDAEPYDASEETDNITE